jgi:hypothetical protein
MVGHLGALVGRTVASLVTRAGMMDRDSVQATLELTE